MNRPHALLGGASAALLVVSCGSSSDPFRVAAGTFGDGASTWRVDAELRGEQVCIRTTYSTGEGNASACVVDDDASALTTHGTSAASGQPTIVHGLTRADVASVRIESKDGLVATADAIAVPSLRDAANSRRGFAIVVSERTALIALEARDDAGNVLEREEVHP